MNDETAVWRLAAQQQGVVAAWQLIDEGLTWNAIRHRTRGLAELQDGVFLTGAAPPSRRQLMWAAALTAPGRFISHASAGHEYGFRPWVADFEVITCAGTGGPVRLPSLLVCRSTTVRGHTATRDGLPVTTAERALADLCRHVPAKEYARCVREALRLGVTNCPRIQAMLHGARGRNRPRRLAELAQRYARLPIGRAYSDPEAYALELLAAAGWPTPLVNHVIAGHRPDLAWPHAHHIVELDGPDFHQFPDEDLRKQRAWERAGWTVARVPTQDVYDHPDRLFAAAEPARTSFRR